MDKLNFYIVDTDYVNYLRKAEEKQRGFSRVPNMDYGEKRKQKFLCGVVLRVNGMEYYVPVSSYRQQQKDNFLIYANNGKVTSSLRFNYMFPIPREIVTERRISNEPDIAYRALLSQELRYCIKNQDTIQRLAERTYKRVNLGKDNGLIKNSCQFKFLEEKCINYCKEKGYVNSPTEYRYKEIEATDIIKLKSCKAQYEVSKSNTNDNKFIVRFKAFDEEHIAVALEKSDIKLR